MAKIAEKFTIDTVIDQGALQAMQLAADSELLAFGAGLVITDDTTAEVIAACLTEELGRFDTIEAMRTAATGPLNTLKRTIDGWFKPGKDKSKALIDLYKAALGTYHQSKLAEREAALQLAAKSAKSGDVATLTQALTVANAPSANPSGTSYSTKWQARIVDLRAYIDEAIMQQRYYLIREDPGGLQKLAQGEAEPAPFAGVVFEKVTGVRALHGR